MALFMYLIRCKRNSDCSFNSTFFVTNCSLNVNFIDSNGTVINTFPMPVKATTGVAFGGPNLDILYVLAGQKVIDGYTALIGYVNLDGPGLYAITGVGKTFTNAPERLDVFPKQS